MVQFIKSCYARIAGPAMNRHGCRPYIASHRLIHGNNDMPSHTVGHEAPCSSTGSYVLSRSSCRPASLSDRISVIVKRHVNAAIGLLRQCKHPEGSKWHPCMLWKKFKKIRSSLTPEQTRNKRLEFVLCASKTKTGMNREESGLQPASSSGTQKVESRLITSPSCRRLRRAANMLMTVFSTIDHQYSLSYEYSCETSRSIR